MFKRILKYLLVAVMVCYTLFALVFIPSQKEEGVCQGVLINVNDNNLEIISSDEIMDILKQNGLDPSGKNINGFYSYDIENFIDSISLIEKSQVYKSIKGYTIIDVDCRIPIVKVYDKENNIYHIDKNGCIIRGIEKALYLPIANGCIDDSIATSEVISIARTINKDEFWNSQIEQIYFDENGYVTMIPRVGNHIIEFGKAQDIKEKFDKLHTFYLNGMNKIGWNKYSKLNIEFGNKVICTQRK
jgi:cell division protein FtsQ